MRPRVWTAAATYFGIVFGVGFVLGVIRMLWIVPWLGERNAELLETPLMLVALVLAARFVVRRLQRPSNRERLAVGCLALSCLLVAEVGVVLLVRGQSVGEFAASRDPVSGSVYLCALVVFALAPSFVLRERVHGRGVVRR